MPLAVSPWDTRVPRCGTCATKWYVGLQRLVFQRGADYQEDAQQDGRHERPERIEQDRDEQVAEQAAEDIGKVLPAAGQIVSFVARNFGV